MNLQILKKSDLKPYVVFLAPPSLEKLRQNRAKVGASAKIEELKEIVERAREIEDRFESSLLFIFLLSSRFPYSIVKFSKPVDGDRRRREILSLRMKALSGRQISFQVR